MGTQVNLYDLLVEFISEQVKQLPSHREFVFYPKEKKIQVMENTQAFRHCIVNITVESDGVLILPQRHQSACATEKRLAAADPRFLEHLQRYIEFCLKQ